MLLLLVGWITGELTNSIRQSSGSLTHYLFCSVYNSWFLQKDNVIRHHARANTWTKCVSSIFLITDKFFNEFLTLTPNVFISEIVFLCYIGKQLFREKYCNLNVY